MKMRFALSAWLGASCMISAVDAQILAAPLPGVTQNRADAPRWIDGTIVQLSVVDAVGSRGAKPGDRFRLRVEAPVCVDGRLAIPVGATAWGEVLSSFRSSAGGTRGRLSWHLREVETAWGPVSLRGDQEAVGASGADSVAVAVYLIGIYGFLLKGKNAGLRTGDLMSGYIVGGVREPEHLMPIVLNHSGNAC